MKDELRSAAKKQMMVLMQAGQPWQEGARIGGRYSALPPAAPYAEVIDTFQSVASAVLTGLRSLALLLN